MKVNPMSGVLAAGAMSLSFAPAYAFNLGLHVSLGYSDIVAEGTGKVDPDAPFSMAGSSLQLGGLVYSLGVPVSLVNVSIMDFVFEPAFVGLSTSGQKVQEGTNYKLSFTSNFVGAGLGADIMPGRIAKLGFRCFYDMNIKSALNVNAAFSTPGVSDATLAVELGFKKLSRIRLQGSSWLSLMGGKFDVGGIGEWYTGTGMVQYKSITANGVKLDPFKDEGIKFKGWSLLASVRYYFMNPPGSKRIEPARKGSSAPANKGKAPNKEKPVVPAPVPAKSGKP